MASVQLIGNATDGYQLTVDSDPFFVKGAGLEFGMGANCLDCPLLRLPVNTDYEHALSAPASDTFDTFVQYAL
ncbi:MAG TPA: hypothetical protein DD655_04525 [Halieaceae bacterium]|nr:hypothetical protein [Halieaceae bacterium]